MTLMVTGFYGWESLVRVLMAGAELHFFFIVNQTAGFLPVINGIAARLDGEGAGILRAIL